MDAWKRFTAIMKAAQINLPDNPPPLIKPMDMPVLNLDHYGAANGGHGAQVSCTARTSRSNVVRFTEVNTGLNGWEVKNQKVVGNNYVWILFREKGY